MHMESLGERINRGRSHGDDRSRVRDVQPRVPGINFRHNRSIGNVEAAHALDGKIFVHNRRAAAAVPVLVARQVLRDARDVEVRIYVHS